MEQSRTENSAGQWERTEPPGPTLLKAFSGNRFIHMFAGGMFGIRPKPGSVLAGAYMILMTNMYLIFEFGHLHIATDLTVKHDTSFTRMILNCYYAAIILAFVTYPICFYYIYCIYKSDFIGMFIYFFWIILYDIANVVILFLTKKGADVISLKISPLEWFGLAARIPMDLFWLSYVLTYALMLIEGRRAGRISLRARNASMHSSEPPKFRLGSNVRRIQM